MGSTWGAACVAAGAASLAALNDVYIYIYIYIERETYICIQYIIIYIYIYIYIYVHYNLIHYYVISYDDHAYWPPAQSHVMKGHAERPHPQKSGVTSLLRSICRESTQSYAYLGVFTFSVANLN